VQRISLKELRRFCDRQFKLCDLIHSLTDHRKKYEIPLSHIFYTLLYTTIINENNFLAKDKIARKKYFKNFIGSKRNMVASDSTLERNLRNNLETSELNSLNIALMGTLSREKLVDRTLKKRCLVFDGSGVSKDLKEIAFIPGEVDLFFQSYSIPKKGKELPSAYRLLKRISNQFGKDSFDLMLFDGLYYSNQLFKTVRNNFNAHVLVKTKENLVIIQEANEIIKHYHDEIEYIKGFDENKLCNYEIAVFNNVKAPTIEYPLKLAVVKEKYKYKNGSGDKEECFYVITTDLTMTGNDMRYGGHLRWKIENNGFKKMNALYESKRKYSNDDDFVTNLLLIMFLAYNIFHLYLNQVDLSESILVGKNVFKDWVKMLYESLIRTNRFNESG
jgi:hypothetical protein